MVQPFTRAEHLEQALEQIRAEGGLRDHAHATLPELMALEIPGRLIKLRALLIALGRCTAQVPRTHHRPQVIAPEPPAHTRWQAPPPPKARPARQQPQLFDARRAASGDRDD